MRTCLQIRTSSHAQIPVYLSLHSNKLVLTVNNKIGTYFKHKEFFKFQRVPGITNIVNVPSSGFGVESCRLRPQGMWVTAPTGHVLSTLDW
jgi:ketopantoate reductase